MSIGGTVNDADDAENSENSENSDGAFGVDRLSFDSADERFPEQHDDTDDADHADDTDHADHADDADHADHADEEEDEEMLFRRRIRRGSSGTFVINLPDDERELLHALPGQLHEMLTSGDATGLRRLFPAAYHLDAAKDAEFHELMRSELVASKAARAKVLEETAYARSLTEEQLLGWMGAVNDLRLVLGTQLDVGEDDSDLEPDHPLAAHYGLYHYLGFLLENIVRALS